MKELIIVGAGGFGRELLQWIKDINKIYNKWSIKGFIDDNRNSLENFKCSLSIIGTIEDWIPKKNEVFAIAIANPLVKEKCVMILKSKGAIFENIIHPTAIIGEDNEIGEGFVAYPFSAITNNVMVGNFVTLLSSGIGHDVKIGNYTTISSQCDITGGVKIGDRVFIGSTVTIIPNRSIGDDVYIGAGSVVISNIKQKSKVFGNPAKRIEV